VKNAACLDFIIAGIPRCGTTFLGQALNGHEDIYCYFMETSLVRHLWMFGADRPFPKEKLPVLESWLASQLAATFLDAPSERVTSGFRRLKRYKELVAEYGFQEDTGPGCQLFDRHELDEFVQAVLSLFRRGLHGAALMRAGCVLLADAIRNRTKRRIIGEKTPTNTMALDPLLAGCPETHVFSPVREPFSAIRSMIGRAKRSSEMWDEGFSPSFFGSMGDYYAYLKKIVRLTTAAPPGRFHVMRYEDLIGSPRAMLGRLYDVLGLPASAIGLEFAEKMILPSPLQSPVEMGFAPLEMAVAHLVLGPIVRNLGYAEEFYTDRGLSLECGDVGACVTKERAIALDGFHREGDEESVSDRWMGKEASVFAIFAEGRQSILLDMDSNFPRELKISPVALTVCANGRAVGATQVGPGLQESRVEVKVRDLVPYRLNSDFLGAVLELHASAAFRPITVKSMNNDMREISFHIRSVVPEGPAPKMTTASGSRAPATGVAPDPLPMCARASVSGPEDGYEPVSALASQRISRDG